ncbi:MAG: hypothetical protein SVT56_09215 [Chloroflexota bacterium]|nr:hypothetical protein [Chloroflexota bacterium]
MTGKPEDVVGSINNVVSFQLWDRSHAWRLAAFDMSHIQWLTKFPEDAARPIAQVPII